MSTTSSFIIPATAEHTATVILIHGLGGSAQDISPIAKIMAKDPVLSHVKWVLPNAPTRAVTVHGGAITQAWYDVLILPTPFDGTAQDEQGLLQSAEILKGIINSEIQSGIDPSRIAMGGFSQGAGMTYLTGFTCGIQLCGLFVLSGRVPLSHKFKQLASPNVSTPSIFWGHGTADVTVLYEDGTKSINFLTKELGLSLEQFTIKTYEGMAHVVSDEEIRDLQSWLVKVLGSH